VRDLDPWDVFHVRGYGEGAIGLNVIAYAAESIGWSQATELFGSSFFGNGVNPSGVVEVPGKLSPEGLNILKEELQRLYGGPRNSAKALVVDNGIKFNKLSVEPESAQFIETRQHQVEEICRWFGVPPHKVMHLMRSTFSNIEHQSIEVVVDCIVPWCKRFEEEADYKLFGVLNRGAFFTKLDLKGLLRGDFKSRQEGLLVMRRAGIINGNEWRRLEEMNEIGEIGEKYIVESNMTTMDRVGEAQPQPSAPVLEDPNQPEDDEEMMFDRTRVDRARALNERTLH
jgi:HK97 family phage portal protein